MGLDYASKHPDKIAGYIGIGQESDNSESGCLQVQAAEDAARATGHDPDSARIEALHAASKPFGDPAFDAAQLMELYGLENRYLDPGAKSESLPALVSPDFVWDDLRYQLLLMDIKGHFVRQIPLMQAVTDFMPPHRLAVPAALIDGDKPAERKLTIGLAASDPWHVPDTDNKGNMNENNAKLNRKVVLLDAASEQAREILSKTP